MKCFKKSSKFLAICVLLSSVFTASGTSAVPTWGDIKIFCRECFCWILEELNICGFKSNSDNNDEHKKRKKIKNEISYKDEESEGKTSEGNIIIIGKTVRKFSSGKKEFEEDRKEKSGKNSNCLSENIEEVTNNEKKFKKLKEKCRGEISGSYKEVVSKKKEVKDFLSKVRGNKKFCEDEDNSSENFNKMVSEPLM